MLNQSQQQKTMANNFASLMKFDIYNFFQKLYVVGLGLKLMFCNGLLNKLKFSVVMAGSLIIII